MLISLAHDNRTLILNTDHIVSALREQDGSVRVRMANDGTRHYFPANDPVTVSLWQFLSDQATAIGVVS